MELGKKLAAAMAANEFDFTFGPIVGPEVDLQIFADGPPYIAAPTIFGWEVLGRPRGIEPRDIGKSFAEFHADAANWGVISSFIAAQIAATCGRFASINLSPVYLGDMTVQAGLRDVLTPRRGLLRRRVAVWADSITLEVMESVKLSKEGLAFLKELRSEGYKISIDDLGSGAHVDPEYVRALVRELTPHEVKLDFVLVRGKTPDEVHELALHWAREVIVPGYAPMATVGVPLFVIEGVSFSPVSDLLFKASETYGSEYSRRVPYHKDGKEEPVYLAGAEQAPAWREMMNSLQTEIEGILLKEGHVEPKLRVAAQLAPVAFVGWNEF